MEEANANAMVRGFTGGKRAAGSEGSDDRPSTRPMAPERLFKPMGWKSGTAAHRRFDDVTFARCQASA